MANQKLVDYVSKMRAAGSTDEQIMAALLNSGWSEVDINMALDPNYIPPADAAPAIPPERATIAVPQASIQAGTRFPTARRRIFMIIFVISIALLLAGAVYFTLIKES